MTNQLIDYFKLTELTPKAEEELLPSPKTISLKIGDVDEFSNKELPTHLFYWRPSK